MDNQKDSVLSLNSIPVIEVEENELGLPVTAAFHVKCHHNTMECSRLTYMVTQKEHTSYQQTVNSWKNIKE